jgi:hypothetical protein
MHQLQSCAVTLIGQKHKYHKESLLDVGKRSGLEAKVKVKVKVKVKFSLCLTKHHAMKTYWGSGGIAPRINIGTRWR